MDNFEFGSPTKIISGRGAKLQVGNAAMGA